MGTRKDPTEIMSNKSISLTRKFFRNMLFWKFRNNLHMFSLLIFSTLCILFFRSEPDAYDNHISGYSTPGYRYKRVDGLVKELFPDSNWLPFRTFNVEKEFRYPVLANMTNLAIRLMEESHVDTKVINDHPFRYIHNPKLLCSIKGRKDDIPLLILIKSKLTHFKLRDTIRNTWGLDVKRAGKFRMAFLLGYITEHQYEVDNESYKHCDIIQEDFKEAYLNVTYKTIMAFNWASQYCFNARTVLFLDDDMFLNLENLEKYILKIDEEENKLLFSGILLKRPIPVRDLLSKWFVDWNEYPYDYYPIYLEGSAIFASMYVVNLFRTVFPYVRYFGFDDVYLGIVAYKLNIVPSETLLLDNNHLRNFKNLSRLIANHGFEDHNLFLKTYQKMSAIAIE